MGTERLVPWMAAALITGTPYAFPLAMLIHPLPLAAIGYVLLYILFGGGLGGAFIIFIVAKMFGK